MAPRVLLQRPVEQSRRSDIANREGAQAEVRVPGSIFSFLPAHGGCRAGAVAQQLSRTLTEGLAPAVLLADFDRRAYSVWSATEPPRRLDGRTWGAFVSEVDGIQVLNAREVNPRHMAPLLNYAREHFSIVCADLTGARDPHGIEVLKASDAVFIVAGTDPASVEGAREKIAWLRSLDLDDRCGMLLEHTPHGVTAAEMEESTGIAVCSLIETRTHIESLARWLAANTAPAASDSVYAVA